jgi:hypothetical protein
MTFENRFIKPLESECEYAMRLAQNRGGARYIVRLDGDNGFATLTHDNPDLLEEDQDVIAIVDHQTVYAVGRARAYLADNGKVDRRYFRNEARDSLTKQEN